MTKLTSKRQRIYDMLKSSDGPLSAESLFELLGHDEMNLSTIYRTLEKFYVEGIVGRNYLDNKAYFYLNVEDHHHYMVCESCKHKFEVDCHIDHLFAEIKEKYGFNVLHHDLNFYGLCKKCSQKSHQ